MSTIKSINPHNQEVIKEYEEISADEAKDRVNLAHETFWRFRKTTFAERAEKMRAVANDLRENTDKYAKMMTREMGKPITGARAEAEKCAWVCEFYAEHAERFLSDQLIETDADESYVSYEPLGVVLAIMPWNYPFWQVFRFAAPTIMAGNTALLKHSTNVQGCAEMMVELFERAGFEKGVFQNLPLENESVEKVLRHPHVKACSLTGSVRAGSAVAKTCGEEIKKTLLELGGSNAFVVFADADLEKAAELGKTARMMNNGQSCIAAKRFILVEEIADDFIEIYKKKVAEMKQGDPMDESTDIGPMAREDLAEELEEQMKKSVEKGAEIVIGGKREKAHFQPTILKNVKKGMPAFDEELFGPVASMIVAKDADEAVKLANDHQYGLGCSFITADIEMAKKYIPQMSDGAVFINELVKSDPRMPFGGTGKSGYGRELGEHGIHEFVNAKAVHIKKEIQ